MTCPECGREHQVMGKLVVDDVLVPDAWVEVLVEMLCKYGGLPARPESRFDEPDEGGQG